jgi:hypothetical protein
MVPIVLACAPPDYLQHKPTMAASMIRLEREALAQQEGACFEHGRGEAVHSNSFPVETLGVAVPGGQLQGQRVKQLWAFYWF